MKKIFLVVLIQMCFVMVAYSQAAPTVHRAAPMGAAGGLLNPDLSVVVDVTTVFTDKEGEVSGDVLTRAVELVFGAYLHPGIRGDVIFCYKGKTGKIKLEEAFITFLALPLGLQLDIGRRFIDFGSHNRLHPHHWKTVDMPLVLDKLFYGHPWVDDRVNLSYLIPNPLNVYFKTSFSVFHNCDPAGILDYFYGRIFNSRTSIDLPWINTLVSYSRAWDERNRTTIQGIELTYRYAWPFTTRKIRFQNEFFFGEKYDDCCGEIEPIPSGLYSLVVLSLDRYTEIGGRYDRIFPEGDECGEWAASLFVTRYLTCMFYLRAQYQHKVSCETENKFFLQISWGFGPHAHKLED